MALRGEAGPDVVDGTTAQRMELLQRQKMERETTEYLQKLQKKEDKKIDKMLRKLQKKERKEKAKCKEAESDEEDPDCLGVEDDDEVLEDIFDGGDHSLEKAIEEAEEELEEENQTLFLDDDVLDEHGGQHSDDEYSEESEELESEEQDVMMEDPWDEEAESEWLISHIQTVVNMSLNVGCCFTSFVSNSSTLS